MGKDADYSSFLKEKDGVHFSETGYEFLANILTDKIKSICDS